MSAICIIPARGGSRRIPRKNIKLMRLSTLPKHNEDLPNDDYPDLSKQEIFR
jgi:hypothetical protein